MTTNTAVDTELLRAGDTVHFYGTTSLVRDELLFSQPVITSYGSELVLTPEILQAYSYPTKESWLTRLGTPDRNGFILADRGPWPEGKLKTIPGTPEHQVARDEAVREVFAEYGNTFSAARGQALKDVERIYGEQTDSWSAQNAAWAKNGARV